MKKNRMEIVLGAGLLVIFIGMILWLLLAGPLPTLMLIIALAIIIIVAITFLYQAMRRKQQRITGEPAEDEFTKLATVYAGNQAFLYSLYLWLLIFVLKGSFEKSATMLGLGILGSCAIYGIFSWYYKKTGKLNEK